MVWILSERTFISFIPATSVCTLLWNSIINHWVSERGDNFQLILSSISVQILTWKCFFFSLWQQLSEVDFAGRLLFSSFWLLYLCCKSLIWCLEIAMFGAAKFLVNGLMSFKLAYKIFFLKKDLKFQLIMPYVQDSDKQWRLASYLNPFLHEKEWGTRGLSCPRSQVNPWDSRQVWVLGFT